MPARIFSTIARIALLTLACGGAHAEESAPPPTPRGAIDRPLLLPSLKVNATVGAALTNIRLGDSGEALAVGIDVGIGGRVQAGLYAAFPVHPDPGFGDLIGNIQLGLAKSANLRLDVGVEHNSRASSFVTGAGVPFKWKFHRMFALVSGSSAARGFGPPLDPYYGPSQFAPADVPPTFGPILNLDNDLLAISVTRGFAMNGVAGSAQLPIGLIFQPHPILSLTVRTGYRLRFVRLENDLEGAGNHVQWGQFIPLAFDLLLSPTRWLDVGFTATLQGLVAQSADTPLPLSGGAYAGVRVFELWLGFHS